ncbi:hypothetical protein SFRURICE_021075 [Spodoptera frugiperda]|uniref:SFRICE_004762 n=1 Tax=Spodoptera frugiperda TaxID=7108 RepID=A0A2H1W5H2_SPOFR|nr:hypothetical protein SFRURICE_021075 [Spodoptera frugiperda]
MAAAGCATSKVSQAVCCVRTVVEATSVQRAVPSRECIDITVQCCECQCRKCYYCDTPTVIMALKKDFDINKNIFKIKLPKTVKFQQAIDKIFKKNNYTKIVQNNTEPEPPDRNKSPNFITDETEFIGKGDIRTSTPVNKHRRSRSKSGTRKTPVPLSFSDEHFYEDLEAYVREMSAARQTSAAMEAGQEQDLWAQLQQKESDLLLAAELGKALLDKNEELKKEQERVTEEYSKKVEFMLKSKLGRADHHRLGPADALTIARVYRAYASNSRSRNGGY